MLHDIGCIKQPIECIVQTLDSHNRLYVNLKVDGRAETRTKTAPDVRPEGRALIADRHFWPTRPRDSRPSPARDGRGMPVATEGRRGDDHDQAELALRSLLEAGCWTARGETDGAELSAWRGKGSPGNGLPSPLSTEAVSWGRPSRLLPISEPVCSIFIFFICFSA